MSQGIVEKIARAVLYEGYMLYPYRPSAIKNQLRFNFGVVYPRSYSEKQTGSDNWEMQTECLLSGNPQSMLEIKVRFLQLVERSIQQISGMSELGDAELCPVARLDVEGQLYQSWEEAMEREISVPACNIERLLADVVRCPATFATERTLEPIRNEAGEIVGAIARSSESLEAMVEISAQKAADDIFKITVRTTNTSSFEAPDEIARKRALMQSLVSTHTILQVRQGEFISLLDPPDGLRDLVANCGNTGTFPVLVGENGERDTVLSSPIILYDYPQIAPESAGDLFDGTEIDEILSLRIMTMTDEEKREMRYSDERARQILERTETLPMEQLMKLHGALREPHPAAERKTK